MARTWIATCYNFTQTRLRKTVGGRPWWVNFKILPHNPNGKEGTKKKIYRSDNQKTKANYTPIGYSSSPVSISAYMTLSKISFITFASPSAVVVTCIPSTKIVLFHSIWAEVTRTKLLFEVTQGII